MALGTLIAYFGWREDGTSPLAYWAARSKPTDFEGCKLDMTDRFVIKANHLTYSERSMAEYSGERTKACGTM